MSAVIYSAMNVYMYIHIYVYKYLWQNVHMGSRGCPKMSATSYQSTSSHPRRANTLFVTNFILLVLSRLRTNLLAASHLLINDTTIFDAVTLTLNKDVLSYESEMIKVQYSNKGTK